MSSLSNIIDFIELRGIAMSEFERECGMANGTLNNYHMRGSDISPNNIDKISKRYGDELAESGYYVMDMAAFGAKGKGIVKERPAPPPPHLRALPPEQILTLMAQAMDKYADAHKAQAQAFADQAALMKNIEKNMARETTQARIEDKLEDILSGVENLSVRQKQILDGTYGIDRKSRVVKPRTAAGSGKKQH